MNLGYIHATSWKKQYGFINLLPLDWIPSVYFHRSDIMKTSRLLLDLDGYADGWYNHFQASYHLVVECFDLKEPEAHEKRPHGFNVRYATEVDPELFMQTFDAPTCRQAFMEIRMTDPRWDDIIRKIPQLIERDPYLKELFGYDGGGYTWKVKRN